MKGIQPGCRNTALTSLISSIQSRGSCVHSAGCLWLREKPSSRALTIPDICQPQPPSDDTITVGHYSVIVTPKLHLCLYPFQTSPRVVSAATPLRWQWSNTWRWAWTVWKCNYSKAGHGTVQISSPSDQRTLLSDCARNFLSLAFPRSTVMKPQLLRECLHAVGRCSSRMHRHMSQLSPGWELGGFNRTFLKKTTGFQL